MTAPPKISVVVPCFNHGEFLPEAVASVTAVGRKDIELIVIDDGSTDQRTREEVQRLEAQGIKAILQENKGLAGARNAAIREARGEYIFPLDADDRMRADWIDAAIQVLDSQPKVGVVYGDAQCFGTRTARWRVGPFDPDQLLVWNYIHASALYRRSIWEQNRGYDGTMPVQGLEDWDFWLGALERGWGFVYIPQIFFDYRQAAESMITRARGFEVETENFISQKHGCLFRKAWHRLLVERTSVKQTTRRLGHLLRLRAEARLGNGNRRYGKPW
jgi:glycosyltransferase involved in cell wall biosynthesis